MVLRPGTSTFRTGSPYLRTIGQFLLVLVSCLAGCWLLNLYGGSAPTVITGEVVDWGTGRPAPDTDVLVDELNSARSVARTDTHGRFQFETSEPPRIYFLFAAPPRYGRLLQTTFGQTVVVYRKRERIDDVIIPAIPATELSGYVYGSDSKPIPGCTVGALTRPSGVEIWTSLQLTGTQRVTAYDRARDDDPDRLWEIEQATTDADGKFVFRQLGADRYFIRARCGSRQRQTRGESFAWRPVLYPDASSVAAAQQIVLLPGERREGINFYMRREKAYSFEGKLVFSRGSTPKPCTEALYDQDLRVFRSAGARTFTSLGPEPCEIDANAGTFRCDSLVPGDYTLYFEVEGSGLAVQTARVQYAVPSTAKKALVVGLQEVPNGAWRSQKPFTGVGGLLDFGELCAAATSVRPVIQVRAWGRGRASDSCYFMIPWRSTRLRLPSDDYTVNAFESAYVPRDRAYLGYSSKFEALVMQHGTHIKLGIGQTLKPSPRILTTSELIEMGLDSLRRAR